eukprot:TRINITY_DN5917_c0_g1_i1.p1 TRINITY_DN5917_c0_g1~~TRINITY_DN5917_c0_g1_i1.p1  ORF type:complete len:253 (+),score=16.45 TRINITY_DN5917_c0_g1_i1:82-759(+)
MPDRSVQVKSRDWWKKSWKNRTFKISREVGIELIKNQGLPGERQEVIPFASVTGVRMYQVKQREPVLVDGEYRFGAIGVSISCGKVQWVVATRDAEEADDLIQLIYSFGSDMTNLETTDPSSGTRSPVPSLTTSFSSRCNMSLSDQTSPRGSAFLSPPSSLAGSPILGFSRVASPGPSSTRLVDPLPYSSPLSSPKPEFRKITTLTAFSTDVTKSRQASLLAELL